MTRQQAAQLQQLGAQQQREYQQAYSAQKAAFGGLVSGQHNVAIGPAAGQHLAAAAEADSDPKRAKLRHLPREILWYNNFIKMIDCILEKKELTIDQLEWVPSLVRALGELVDFGGKRSTYEGFKNAFWRCIHRVDSLIFQDYEFMKQLRQMLCEARQMHHPDVGKTWDEIEEEEAAETNNGKQLASKAYENLAEETEIAEVVRKTLGY